MSRGTSRLPDVVTWLESAPGQRWVRDHVQPVGWHQASRPGVFGDVVDDHHADCPCRRYPVGHWAGSYHYRADDGFLRLLKSVIYEPDSVKGLSSPA